MRTLLTVTAILSILSIQAQVTPAAYTTRYDYVQGNRIIALEDFSSTKLGDFPVNWKTNGTAEVVTMTGKPGKWLKLNKEGVWFPTFIKDLPENFTLDFDLGVNKDWDSQPFVLNITNLSDPKEYTDYYHYVNWKGIHTIHMEFQPARLGQRPGSSKLQSGKDGNYDVNKDIEYLVWDNGGPMYAHISLWRQNQRLRVYLNGEKIYDVQEVFDPKAKYNAITFAQQGSYNLNDYTVLGNIRLAVGAPDTRKKVFTKTGWSTSGILFNPNSAEILPESYGVLREIGMALKDSASRLTIIGHTDSDGDDKANLTLSGQRATAVKNYLVEKFGFYPDNIEIVAKGETVPVDVNTTVLGKANNRRVEFVALPITVKPGTNLPITVKPGTTNLPITVKPGGQ